MADLQASQQEGITAISVRGFKSIAEESRVEIRPLTILAGANSSGKSSIMQPLLLMKQTLEASYDPGPLLLDGPNAKFTSFDQVVSRPRKDSANQEFSIEIEMPGDIFRAVFVIKDHALEIREVIYGMGEGAIRLDPDQRSDEIVKAVNKSVIKGMFKVGEWIGAFKPFVVRRRCFLDISIEMLDDKSTLALPILPKSWSHLLNRIIHIPGLRGNPERVYNRTAVGPDFPGTFEHYAASVIAHWQVEDGDRLRFLWGMLQELGLTWKVTAKAVNDTQLELLVGRLPKSAPADDLVNIADVGFGVSQVLPVLVALLVARQGQLVYLEQPELHLHPRAQHALATILASAAKRGVKVVVETHSALLLRSLQTLVAKGNLNPGLVKLYWFWRNSEDGMTEIQGADLNENGAFGDWPEDFDDVVLEAEGAYLDAVAERSRIHGTTTLSPVGD